MIARLTEAREGSLRRRECVTRARAPGFFALGLLGFGNIFGFVVALSYVTAFNSALLHPVIPVIAAGAAAAMGVERLTARVACGVFLGASGALVVVAFGVGGDDSGEKNVDAERSTVIFGNVVLLGQCCCMGVLLVLQKAIMSSTGLPPTTTTFFYNVVATALAVVATPALVGAEAAAYRFGDWAALAATFYGAVFGICFVYVTLGWATHRVGPTWVSLSMTLQPPLNALLSVLFMGRRSFTAGEVGGGVLISAGLAVTALARGPRDRGAKVAARESAAASDGGDDDDDPGDGGHLALGGGVAGLGAPLTDPSPVV